jgi:hypothetical protein
MRLGTAGVSGQLGVAGDQGGSHDPFLELIGDSSFRGMACAVRMILGPLSRTDLLGCAHWCLPLAIGREVRRSRHNRAALVRGT